VWLDSQIETEPEITGRRNAGDDSNDLVNAVSRTAIHVSKPRLTQPHPTMNHPGDDRFAPGDSNAPLANASYMSEAVRGRSLLK